MRKLKRQARRAVCYVEMAALILACVAFSTACSSGEENNSASQSADAQQPQQQQPQQPQQNADVQQPQQPQQQTQAPAGQANTTGDWSRIPGIPEKSYLTVNGVSASEGTFYYSSDGDEALIVAVFVYNGVNYAFGVSIEEDVAKEGAAFNNPEAYDKGCEIEIENLDTGEDFQATNEEVHIGLYKFTNRQYAMFYVKLVGGVTIEMAGEAQFVEESQLDAALASASSAGNSSAGGSNAGNSSAGSGSTGNSNSSSPCVICHGSGKCTTCDDGDGRCSVCGGTGSYGTGTYGYNMCYVCFGSGKCNSCNGSGVCKYCDGTGKKIGG